MSGVTIAVLGGGVGGLVAANELRRLLPSQHHVVLIEKNLQHAFAPSFLWIMVGDRRPEQVARDLRTLSHPGVEVMQAEAVGIDPGAQRVETTQQSLRYDYLVIALGAEYAPETIPGLEPAAHTFYTWDGSAALFGALRSFPETGGTPRPTPHAPRPRSP